MKPIGLDVQRKMKWIPLVNIAVFFTFYINVMYYRPAAKIIWKAYSVMCAGMVAGFLIQSWLGTLPHTELLVLGLQYALLLLMGIWFLHIQEEIGVPEY